MRHRSMPGVGPGVHGTRTGRRRDTLIGTLFPDDLRRQKAMLLAALVLVRASLRDFDAITPTLRRLGAGHVAYGAKPELYPIVGQVLIGSMSEIAGGAWRPEYEHAWAAAFELVAGAMLDGAASAELADAA